MALALYPRQGSVALVPVPALEVEEVAPSNQGIGFGQEIGPAIFAILPGVGALEVEEVRRLDRPVAVAVVAVLTLPVAPSQRRCAEPTKSPIWSSIAPIVLGTDDIPSHPCPRAVGQALASYPYSVLRKQLVIPLDKHVVPIARSEICIRCRDIVQGGCH